jgi:hypothetical protein
MDEARETIKQALAQFDIKENVLQKLKDTKLPIPNYGLDVNIVDEWEAIRQQYIDLSNVPYTLLGEYYEKFSAMIAYSLVEESMADIDLAIAKSKVNLAEEMLLLIQPKARADVQQASSHAEEIYINAEKERLEKYAYYKMMSALNSGYVGRRDAISREISRRQKEISN